MPKKIETEGGWLWSVHGKHPVTRDFFTIGDNSPLSRAFFDWVDRGAQLLLSQKGKDQAIHSFRFWFKAPIADLLLCGLLRSSCDRLARPYPLMILGAGFLPGWEKNWELLPAACEKTWENLEYIVTKKHASLALLQAELKLLKPPENNWGRLLASVGHDGETNISGDEYVRCREMTIVKLKNYSGADFFQHIMVHHKLLKNKEKNPPKAVFIGGQLDHTSMFVLESALKVENYLQLWSCPSLRLLGEDDL